jgi:hypothetical protein
MSALGVRRAKAALSAGCKPTRQPLQPEAIGAVMEVTKWLKTSTHSAISLRCGIWSLVPAASRWRRGRNCGLRHQGHADVESGLPCPSMNAKFHVDQ